MSKSENSQPSPIGNPLRKLIDTSCGCPSFRAYDVRQVEAIAFGVEGLPMPIQVVFIDSVSHSHPNQYTILLDEAETSILLMELDVYFQDIVRPSTETEPSGIISPDEANDIRYRKSFVFVIGHFSRAIVFINALVLIDLTNSLPELALTLNLASLNSPFVLRENERENGPTAGRVNGKVTGSVTDDV